MFASPPVKTIETIVIMMENACADFLSDVFRVGGRMFTILVCVLIACKLWFEGNFL